MTAPRAQRLFLALWPTDAVRSALVEWQSLCGWPVGAKVVPPERLHMTLHFLGSVQAQSVGRLVPLLREVKSEPFTIVFGRSQDWRGIAVLRPLQTPAALTDLHGRLADVLRICGVPVEDRAYRAHVTLARNAGGAVRVEGPGFEWPVDSEFALVESLAGGQGYQIVERFDSR